MGPAQHGKPFAGPVVTHLYDECAFVDQLSEVLAVCPLVHGGEEGVPPAADTGITAERPDGAP